MKSIASRLTEKQVLILDGAMGTELFRRGIQTRLPIWSARALMDSPETVRQIHEDYIRAGAEIITTNTFRTTSRALGKVGMADRAKELTFDAVKMAKEARDQCAENPVWIAGSVAPLEDCYKPELIPDAQTAFSEHAQLVSWLVEAGVDLILIETMNTIEEALIAARATGNCGIDIFVSWTCAPDGTILNGASIKEGVRSLAQYQPAAFLVNCTPCSEIYPALIKIRDASNVPFGAYANIGRPEPVFGWEFTDPFDPTSYAREAENWVQSGARIIGGCCGTTPGHISALKRLQR